MAVPKPAQLKLYLLSLGDSKRLVVFEHNWEICSVGMKRLSVLKKPDCFSEE
jgi:hypothetical protein